MAMSIEMRKKISRRMKKFWKNHPEERAARGRKVHLYYSKGTTGEQPQANIKHESFKQTITICKYCKRPF